MFLAISSRTVTPPSLRFLAMLDSDKELSLRASTARTTRLHDDPSEG
jgi:hypothetical protein